MYKNTPHLSNFDKSHILHDKNSENIKLIIYIPLNGSLLENYFWK